MKQVQAAITSATTGLLVEPYSYLYRLGFVIWGLRLLPIIWRKTKENTAIGQWCVISVMIFTICGIPHANPVAKYFSKTIYRHYSSKLMVCLDGGGMEEEWRGVK